MLDVLRINLLSAVATDVGTHRGPDDGATDSGDIPTTARTEVTLASYSRSLSRRL
jgi:hypothetical protein